MCHLLELYPNFKLKVQFASLLSELWQHLLLFGQSQASVRMKHASKLLPHLWRCSLGANEASVNASQPVPDAGVHQYTSETQQSRNTLMTLEIPGQDHYVLLWKSSSALLL